MEAEYHDITANLDAREVLRYLNDLGIRNISGEVLKSFITDLKKFIKYDLQKSQEPKPLVVGPERLHSASTFCSRIRSKVPEGNLICTTCHRECSQNRRVFRPRSVQSAPNLGLKETEMPPRRACSCVKIEKKSETSSAVKTTGTSSSNIIRVAKQPTMKKCDPVTLYHYYTSLWTKYKSNVPGENDWAELRWSMRQKMAGYSDKENKIPSQPKKSKNVIKQPSNLSKK